MPAESIRADELSWSACPGAAVMGGVSFVLPAAGMLWLRGAAGAGKTSLLRTLALQQAEAGGRLHLLGQPCHRATATALAALRRRIAYVPAAASDDAGLIAHLTLAETVALPMRLSGLAEPRARREVAELLAWAGLEGQAKQPVGTLPASRQRLALLLRALACRPALILADEPCAGLDATQRHWVMAVLRALNQDGISVLLASHDDALIAEYPAAELQLAPPSRRAAGELRDQPGMGAGGQG